MATTVKVMSEQKRARYSAEYRAEALLFAERVGVAATARVLGLHSTQIYEWRARAIHQPQMSHSIACDCGWQHRDLIRKYGLVASMSGQGNCYDNALVESFFLTLKVESIHGEPLVSPETLRRQLFEYIEVEYNRTRRHSALGYISPDAFEAQIAA